MSSSSIGLFANKAIEQDRLEDLLDQYLNDNTSLGAAVCPLLSKLSQFYSWTQTDDPALRAINNKSQLPQIQLDRVNQMGKAIQAAQQAMLSLDEVEKAKLQGVIQSVIASVLSCLDKVKQDALYEAYTNNPDNELKKVLLVIDASHQGPRPPGV